jgi:hypothetical protein
MDKKKLRFEDERFLKIRFANDELLVDVNDNDMWNEIFRWREKITRVESTEWVWDVMNDKVIFH